MATTAPETEFAPLILTLFGPLRVLVAGQPLPRLHSRKALWLLALLALRHGRPVEREWLAGTLWPDADQEQAFANLRPVLSDLRRALGPEGARLQSPGRHTLCLNLAGADVDVLAFDAAIARKTLESLARAVALYAGPLLEGCAEEWAPQERGAREEDCLCALGTLADAALAAGDYRTATDYSRRAVALDPWREAARRGLMEALSRGGDTNAALQVYREFTELLRSDPRAVPDAETSALYSRLRAEAKQRTAGPTVPAAEAPAPSVTGHLPHPLTDLVGREDERLEVAARLRRSRLVTLTGPGGIGKTRLAIEVAREVVREYPDGAWMVALETLSDREMLSRQIALLFGLQEESDRTRLHTVTDHVRGKQLLLVLDNCEHILEASAHVTAHLLRECAGVRVLATSREPLGITGETAWAVPALPVPDPAHLPAGRASLRRVLMGYEGVQLFVERAQAVQKTFTLSGDDATAVAQICARLEGIPLAIELAAARIKAMTVTQIAARLDDHLGLLTGGSRVAQSRQRTLRATLDWSYDLLGGAERLLLARLSAFAGGWTLEAAEAVCAGEGVGARQVLDLMASLVDKSLVVFGGSGVEERAPGAPEGARSSRYRLLETVRQYAAERLGVGAEAVRVRSCHWDYFLALAEEAEPRLTGVDQEAWLARLEAERANLRAALDWCGVRRDRAQDGLRLAGALGRFWEMHGHYGEGRAYLAGLLGQGGAGGRGRAKALSAAGVLAFYQGDYAAAQAAHEEGLALFREQGDRAGTAWALNDLGDVAGARGDDGAARRLFEESLALFRELGDRQGIASLLHHLGRLVRDEGDLAGARALYEEGLATQRDLGNVQGTAWALHHLGHLTGVQGDTALARSLQEEALAIFQGLGNRQGAAWSLQELAKVAVIEGDTEAAQAVYQESLALFRELGHRQGVALSLDQLGAVVGAQGDHAAARALREEALSIFRELGNEQAVARLLDQL